MIHKFNVGDMVVEESKNKKVILLYAIILDVYADYYVYQIIGQDNTQYHMKVSTAHKMWEKVS